MIIKVTTNLEKDCDEYVINICTELGVSESEFIMFLNQFLIDTSHRVLFNRETIEKLINNYRFQEYKII